MRTEGGIAVAGTASTPWRWRLILCFMSSTGVDVHSSKIPARLVWLSLRFSAKLTSIFSNETSDPNVSNLLGRH